MSFHTLRFVRTDRVPRWLRPHERRDPDARAEAIPSVPGGEPQVSSLWQCEPCGVTLTTSDSADEHEKTTHGGVHTCRRSDGQDVPALGADAIPDS